MSARRCGVRRVAATVAAVLALGWAAGPADAAPKPGQGTPITVMTRNIYLGGDITRPLTATAGKTGGEALVAFGNANHALRGVVSQTDFPARSKLLAREVAATEPDMIGLQEVALWRSGPMQLAAIGVSNATTVDYDFLATLLADLAAIGEPYVAVNVQEESDVEGPSFLGNPFAGTMSDASDVRLTMRDVLLKRADDRVRVLASGGGHYAARLPFSVAEVTFQFIRGYNWADVRVGAKTLRVVNTHLESQFSFLALAQARELFAGAARVPGQEVVVLCDCNSDPLNHTTKPGDPTPHSAPYDFMTGPGGFTDEWLQFAPADQGWTSGLSEFVNDPDTSQIDHRIDLVLARGADGQALPADQGRIVGVDPANRSATGLWPSDHAGVVLRLRP
ncbi:MAG: endonuclease/exonuclease/phosphatase family protein [Sporichthyaceae bacterium]